MNPHHRRAIDRSLTRAACCFMLALATALPTPARFAADHIADLLPRIELTDEIFLDMR
jgi:hypothetical protein